MYIPKRLTPSALLGVRHDHPNRGGWEDHQEHLTRRNASTIFCSQLPVSKWHEYFAEPTIADALLDRIIPKAHRIELKGNSKRTQIIQLS